MPHSSPFLERPHLGPLPCTLFWRSACANGLAFLLLGTCRSISGNPGLTGNLPPEIGSLTNLTVLDLHDNNFTGVIPNLARLGNLVTLNMSHNHIGGYISDTSDPDFQFSLITLDLSYNNISGDILPFIFSIQVSVLQIL
jgi:Leucine-rich repeat (LRR) protein